MTTKNSPKSAIFIPKTSGLGWTLNLRHPLSWIVLVPVFILAIYKLFLN